VELLDAGNRMPCRVPDGLLYAALGIAPSCAKAEVHMRRCDESVVTSVKDLHMRRLPFARRSGDQAMTELHMYCSSAASDLE